jgi:tRNA (guanine-N7-)-methyltransferase
MRRTLHHALDIMLFSARLEHVTTKRRLGPYADCPRLPEGDHVDLRSLAKVSFREIELEVGPGPKAGFLVERAVSAPDALLIGLEIRRKWASVGDGKLAKNGHAARARVFCEDARLALPRLGPDASIARAFLHFPDPWWKKRHQKRLVMGDVFLDNVARLLVRGGELYVQTDVEERAELYETAVHGHSAFTPAGDVEGSPRIVDNPYGARSPREHRAIADGLPVWRMLWKRRA